MLSMSFGLMSATRFTIWSWLDAKLATPPERDACEMTFNPLDIAELFMITPSTTYSGLNPPRTVLTPRSCTCVPPPGAPELVLTIAPGIFPCNALSIVCAGTRFSFSAEITVTAFGAFTEATDVAVPVMTCLSSSRTSRARVTAISERPAPTG